MLYVFTCNLRISESGPAWTRTRDPFLIREVRGPWCVLPCPRIRLIMPFLTFPFSCSVRSRTGWVAARLLHTEHARMGSDVQPSLFITSPQHRDIKYTEGQEATNDTFIGVLASA